MMMTKEGKTEVEKKVDIKKFYDVVMNSPESGNRSSKGEDYRKSVVEFVNTESHTKEEIEAFITTFLYRDNATASLGMAKSQCKKENRPEGNKAFEMFKDLLYLLKGVGGIDSDKADKVCKGEMRKNFYNSLGTEVSSVVNRAIATVMPERVSTVANDEAFFQAYDWFAKNKCVAERKDDDDWYSCNVTLMAYLKSCLCGEGGIKKCNAYDVSHFILRIHELVDGQEKRSERPIVKYGPPGTGKTYTAQADIRNIFNSWSVLATGGKVLLTEEEYSCRVQFHPSYGYEDFIEGLRPDKNGKLTLVNGDFKEFCKKAGRWECDLYELTKLPSTPHKKVSEWLDVEVGEFKNLVYNKCFNNKTNVCKKKQLKIIRDIFSKDYWGIIWKCAEYDRKISLRDAIPPYCMLIDEINRAELSRVFGELMYALEYRGPDGMIKTQYSRLDSEDTAMIRVSDGSSRFFVPHNVFILGTMNTIDRSIESFDFALRRRFLWERVPVDLDVAESWLKHNKILKSDKDVDALIDSVEELNKKIRTDKGDDGDYEIGHAYLMKYSPRKRLTLNQAKTELWESAVAPLLEEYLRGTGKKLKTFKDVFFAKEKSATKESAD